MKYDDASWHYGGNFPADLPSSAGATHIAMFVTWAATAGLLGELHTEDAPDLLEGLLDRTVTPAEWFMSACAEKFTDEDLNAEGNSFAAAYYVESDVSDEWPKYLADYQYVFRECGDYRVPDTWDSFDKLKPILDKRLAHWRSPKE